MKPGGRQLATLALASIWSTACTFSQPRTTLPPVQTIPTADKLIKKPGDPTPQQEPLSRYGNPESYNQFGRRYVIMDSADGFAERGIASWYGPKFHGKRTSSGETYDMHAMTAAHKTLPIPTWVHVKNLKNGKEVIVKVNDRGPFVENRVIDLSYEAAQRLDMITDGTGMVDVRVIEFDAQGRARITPSAARPQQTIVAQTAQPDPVEQAVAVVSATVAPEKTTSTREAPAPENREVTPAAPSSSPTELRTLNLYAQIGAFGNLDNAERQYIRLRDSGIGRVDIVERLEPTKLYRVRVGPVHDTASYDQLVAELKTLGLDPISLVIEDD